MSFMHPWALALAGLVLVPLVLHLVRRDTRRRVAFPAIRYLRSAERQSARSMKIRDLLLAAVRAGLVILVALIASRPLVGRGDASSHPPTDLVLVVDNTASMTRTSGDASMFDVAVASARLALDHAGPDDRVWLASTVDGVAIVEGTAGDAMRALESLRPSDAGGTVSEAVERLTPLVPAAEERVRELHLYTDLQAGSVAVLPELSGDWSTVVLHLEPETRSNGAVAGIGIGPASPVPPGGVLIVSASLVRWPSGPERDPAGEPAGADRPDVRLLLDGRTVGVQKAEWDTDVVFSIPAPESGSHVVRVEIDPSGMRSDDGRQSGFRVAEISRVATGREEGVLHSFLVHALQTLEAEGRLTLDAPGEVDVEMAFDGRLPDPHARAAATDPAAILVPPLDAASLPAFNQRLATLGVPWRAEPDPRRGSVRIAMDDPPGLQGMLVHRRHLLRRIPAPRTDFDSVLARTDDGAPWLVRGTASGGGSFVLLGSPLHPDATRLPVSTGMVEFTDALVNRWARPGEPPTSRVAGETIPLPPRADSLAGPIGPSVPVEGGAPWTPRHAGIWRLSVRTDRGTEARYVGVNVPSAESDPSAFGTDGTRSEADDVTIVSDVSEWPDAVFTRRRGRDARTALLPAVLLLLALEAILAAPRRRRAAGPQIGEGGR